MSDDFVHLHLHSDMSQLDGCTRISEYVEEAKKREHRAIAFTDHGTMRGYLSQHEECKKRDIKPIYGFEAYISPDMRRRGLTDEEKADITKGLKRGEHRKAIKEAEGRLGIRDRWHLTIWAMNNEGLLNLYRLSSAAFIEGFYYKPRIDIKELEKYSEGLMVSTGCLSSPVNDGWLLGKRKFALDFADELYRIFGDRLWLEVQPHAIRDQRVANKLMLALNKRYKGAKLLATQDAHYLHQSDAEHHEVLLCIGTGSNLSEPVRFKFDGDEFHFRTRKEMFRAFRKNHEFIPSQLVKQALDSTMEFAERCSAVVEVDYHAVRLPDPGIPPKYKGDTFAYLRDLCLDGWRWRDIPHRANAHAKRNGMPRAEAMTLYTERLKKELKALKKQRFVPYFLIIHDLYRFARGAKIMIGPGRGSVGGSLVAYLIGITSVDPIEHGLLFERFINPFRVDMPDCDMDFEDKRRHEIIEYMVQKYGRDKVCQIATVGKLSGKQCLKDVSRTLEVPLAEVNQVTASIIERSSGDERASQTIEDSFKDFEVCRQFNKKYPQVLHHAKRLEGMAKNLGIHAAGVVASPVPLTDLVPLEIRKHNGEDIIVSAVDMYGVAAAGLVKLDVLGLRTLTVLRECCEEIERRHGRHIDLESTEVDLNDPKVLDGFTAHDYGGVFQYDTPSADKVCQGVKFTSFEDVAAMTALNRPGTSRSGLATKYVQRKKNPKLVAKVDFHPKVSEITKDTLGIIVYQEHVIKIFTDIAGFAPGTADSLRKTIAKKFGDETLGKERVRFVEGAKKVSGVDEKTANKIMDAITFFGSYGFNKSHATEYGMIAYWGMWLKTYYPMEFYWALLKNEPDRIRIQQLAKDAKKHEIDLLPPHVSKSGVEFTLDDAHNAVRGSLIDIKGVGAAASASIMENQPYKDLMDFIERVDRRKVHKGVVLALTRAGALDGMLPNPRWLVENMEAFWKAKPDEQRAMLARSKGEPQWTDEERQLAATAVNPLAFGKHPVDAYEQFMKEAVRIPIADMGSEDFFKDYNNKSCWLVGVIVEVKYNQIGDFHSGTLPSEAERKKMMWGRRYANVNIEDRSGKQNRVKFDYHVFDDYREIIDRGVGTAVVAYARVSEFTGTLRAHFAVDLEKYRERFRAGEELTLWERLVGGRHPAKHYPWPSEKARKARVTNERFWASRAGGVFTGIVAYIRTKYDSRGNLMAFVGMVGADWRSIEVVVFAGTWVTARKVIKTGRLLKIEVQKQPDRRFGLSCVYDGGQIKWLRKSAKPRPIV